MQSINHRFVLNNKVYDDPIFPLPVRVSAKERIKRHSLHFAIINSVSSLAYHLMTLNAKFALKRAAQSFMHKGFIGLAFFYSHELVWGWINKQNQQKNQKKKVTNWSSCLLTSAILFPAFLGLNMLYNLPAKKKIMRSIVDILLLNAFALEFDRSLRRGTKILTDGTIEEKQKVVTFTYLKKGNQ